MFEIQLCIISFLLMVCQHWHLIKFSSKNTNKKISFVLVIFKNTSLSPMDLLNELFCGQCFFDRSWSWKEIKLDSSFVNWTWTPRLKDFILLCEKLTNLVCLCVSSMVVVVILVVVSCILSCTTFIWYVGTYKYTVVVPFDRINCSLVTPVSRQTQSYGY